MIEPNPVNLKQDISFPGASKKSRKGKTGKEPEQMMPFACVMGNACRTTTQKTGKIPLNFRPDKGKQNNILSAGKGKTEKTNQSLNNILGAGKDKTEKTNQSLPVKGKGIAESSHGAILKGEATKDINPFMNASKGKGTKTNRSFSGKINLQSESGGQKQIGAEVKNLLGSGGQKQIGTGKDEVRSQKSEGRRQKAEMADAPGLLKFSLKNAVVRRSVLADEAVKESRSLRAADTVGQNFRNGKNDAALFKDGKNDVVLFKDGGLKKNGAGINNALVRGRRPEVRGQRSEVRGQRSELARRQFGGVRGQKAKMVDAPGLLKFNLKNAVAVKGKSAVEPDKTVKNPFTLIKDDGGKNGVENLLERSISSHSPSRSPLHSIDKISSAGAYHNTTSHASGGSSAVNESVNSHAIEPRVLINQIASGVKRPGRVRITLNPPRLGTLDVDVLVRDNKVHVMLQPENNDVRQILQSNVESLKSSLRNQGLVADTINVSVQEKSDGANHGSGQSETLFKEGRNRKGNEEDQGREQNSLNHNPSSFEEENPRVRSDGRISLFA